MNKYSEILKSKKIVSSMVFLKFIETISKRINNENCDSISLTECENLGFSLEDSIICFSILIKVGLINCRVMVYNDEDDEFDDFTGQVDLEEIDDSRMRLTFIPVRFSSLT